MSWTKAQQKVIDTRNKNLLVSAAAGSGKTAVLVERIITMISEGEHPLDIDHLLVVTFTNAAAAEMRDRIGKAIEAKLLLDPDNKHLQKQVSLLQSAQITTIHSFCLNVIRNYFHHIDLDPTFKIAEESEITLMKSDVISELLEQWYEEGSEEFHTFVESYSYSKSDAPIEDIILQLYHFSMSDPWPEKWIAQKRNLFEIDTLQDMNQSPWMKELLSYVRVVLEDLRNKNAEALMLCHEADGPSAYESALLSDRNMLDLLLGVDTYEAYSRLFSEISYERLSTKKEEGVIAWKKERVKELREQVKKGMKDLATQFFYQTPEEMHKDLQNVKKVMQVLFDLTLEFMSAFAKKKEEKNLIDFNDIEHFALKILVKEQQDQNQKLHIVPSQAAMELSEWFDEILIDEYQDSNMVQETILQSISKERMGKPNRFMVGDVKQSIYKFRLAMPEIFMEKFATYSDEDVTGDGQINHYQRIDLDRNFRSRKIVLEYVNHIFEQIMQKSIGGITYDEAAALKYGELFEETLEEKVDDWIKGRLAQETELLLVTEEEAKQQEDIQRTEEMDSDSEWNEEEEEEEAVYSKKELEARAIAKRIKELTDPRNGMMVFDHKAKAHRPASYRDIVILLRSMTGWSEVFVNTLMQEGIPAYADTGTGYFQTLEIMTILNMLRIIDNPRQDIPFVGVLYSPIVGLTTTELAIIRAADRNGTMYNAALSYVKEGSDVALLHKLTQFLDQLEEYRSMVNYKPIHELLQLVLEQTGYIYYISALPGGERRRANIDMLISQAVRFEKGSYSGLFHFIRYIEKLHKYEVDFGEATTAGEQDDTVRIMSIHKSKGLEFPIVIVAGMSKQFNTQDIRSKIVLHNEYGVGPDYIDSERRTKIATLPKKVIQKKVQIENLGEELRVLYVAMTRAKEKLIMTGYLKSMEEIKGKEFTFFELLAAKSYLDLVLPAMVNRMDTLQVDREEPFIIKGQDMLITVLPKSQLLKEEIARQLFIHRDREELMNINPEEVYEEEFRKEIRKRLEFTYPYQKEAGLKVKMTVSELKKLGQFMDEEQSVNLYQDHKLPMKEMTQDKSIHTEKTVPSNTETENEEFEATVPNFISQNTSVVTGTDRGTLYHKVLELIDLRRTNSWEDFNIELQRLVQAGKIQDKDIRQLKLDNIYRFTQSSVASRMRTAQKDGKLYKEKQFVFGIKAAEVIPSSDSEELILIQGIIDVFFEEEGELVLLDYKSDLVRNPEELISRYKVQLEYYKRALEQMLMKRVKEMIIYSLPFGSEIRIDS